jgi:hypothetical protein
MPPVLFEMLADFGITREALRGFSGHVPAFADNGYPFWVCPGTSCWNTLIGRLPNARANLLDAAEVGLARGAAGYLITDWGDNGHLHPPSVSFPPLAHGAALAWCAASNRDIDVAAFLDREIFQDTTANLSSALEAAGGVYRHTGLRPMNGSPLHAHLIGQGIAALGGFLGTPDAEGLERVIDELGGAAERVGRACPLGEDGELIRRELLQAIRLARHGAWKIAREAGFSCPGTEDLRRDLREAIEEQKECWLQRSRPGGLSDSVARLERTLLTYG